MLRTLSSRSNLLFRRVPTLICRYPNSTKTVQKQAFKYFSTEIAPHETIENEETHHAVVSTFDLFSIGIGPSSSHTVGPMRAAKLFLNDLIHHDLLDKVCTLKVNLYGSLAQTGVGHGTPSAILMGLEGETPENIATENVNSRVEQITNSKKLNLNSSKLISFDPKKDLVLNMHLVLEQHSNGMRFTVFDENGDVLATNEYFSIGGGFVVNEQTQVSHGQNVYYKDQGRDAIDATGNPVLLNTRVSQDSITAALPFSTARDLLELCNRKRLSVAEIVMLNELNWRNYDTIIKDALKIWDTMNDSIRRGCTAQDDAILPGNIKLKRRAPALYKNLFRGVYGLSIPMDHFNIKEMSLIENQIQTPTFVSNNPEERALGLLRRKMASPKNNYLSHLDYLSVYAIAVNEENAAGGRVVTAPTNGAAGIIPAVLKYYLEFYSNDPLKDALTFLFTASAIGMLFKRGASISAAEVGCQGEVGVACSMSAAAFAAVMGGTPDQVENAAEIGMEHNLGLTCDPVDGLVQIPCIERNALGAVKAVTAAQLALNGNGSHVVHLDQVIQTMKETGHDMMSKYKETSQGGLAVNVPLC
ncbi:hypothetical protein BB560_004569 [Smittium megazygosporum]|uniref:L-serine ammonia-lyase n=1 Tax=Smittium megazygosporum TaxID=133381 RepID=A0A2T9Z8V5_9FUNG|nr:hypothetical protein BB560_004569 [Smittium megazygosporum]